MLGRRCKCTNNKIFDPSYSVKTTLGQVNYTKNDDGTYTYTDKYDFNERKNKPSKTFIESVKEKGLDPYAQVRNIATYFGPGPGEGEMLILNFKQVDFSLLIFNLF